MQPPVFNTVSRGNHELALQFVLERLRAQFAASIYPNTWGLGGGQTFYGKDTVVRCPKCGAAILEDQPGFCEACMKNV